MHLDLDREALIERKVLKKKEGGVGRHARRERGRGWEEARIMGIHRYNVGG